MRIKALGIACLAALLAASPAVAAAPVVEQMVVFRDGDAVTRTVTASEARVRVGRRRCTCSTRARDSGGLFVRSIKGERNRGQDGWVYKVGRRGATAGAGDPSGALGRGRLKPGQRVTWFYCRLRDGGCQRTLTVDARPEPGAVSVTVRGYDDEGRGVPVAGATVTAGSASAVSGADGSARLALPAGPHRLVAERDGVVRSFPERVAVP